MAKKAPAGGEETGDVMFNITRMWEVLAWQGLNNLDEAGLGNIVNGTVDVELGGEMRCIWSL